MKGPDLGDVVKWLYPGLRVKRWILLVALGVIALSAGLAILIDAAPMHLVVTHIGSPYVIWAKRAGPRSAAGLGVAVMLLGLAAVLLGFRNAVASMLMALAPRRAERVISSLHRRRSLERGQQIVVVGGGTGLSTLLRGLKVHTCNLTAIVTVADDGGSSGILRRDMGVLPPGDIRNCLVALADTEGLMADLFAHRFEDGAWKGHSFGNLFIATLSEVAGSFETAVKLSSRVLAVRGRVLPSTLSDVALRATMHDGREVRGESAIPAARGHIKRIALEPADASPLPDTLDAISKADIILLGPGSLYTSVIPNLLVSGVADAIRASRALKVYVCNVMTQPGETDHYSVFDHVDALRAHVGDGLVDCVLVNTARVADADLLARYTSEGAEPVRDDSSRLAGLGIAAIRSPLASLTNFVRHDPDQLATAVIDLLSQRFRRP